MIEQIFQFFIYTGYAVILVIFGLLFFIFGYIIIANIFRVFLGLSSFFLNWKKEMGGNL